MLTMFDPPLARAMQSQTRSLTRLRLFLAAVPSNAVHPLLALQHNIDTICDGARVPKPCATFVLSTAEGVTGPVRILIRTDGSSPSNVSLAAGPRTPNPACTLVDAARSTSAGDIELSSSALLFLDDSFEGLAATKNAPPLRITSNSSPLFLAIQHRSLVKYTSQPESIMDPSDRIDRLMSNTIDCCDPSYFSVVA